MNGSYSTFGGQAASRAAAIRIAVASELISSNHRYSGHVTVATAAIPFEIGPIRRHFGK
ncbi:hypothetical protein [Paenibacillus whitsoniae]|uniref:hypothetical protein n=1 Tax=Paenibacillus whitsoniae TaxID=2496558 RepID=UPI0013DFF917|nr:hypothetical protein [Paenibacillus whitsoniae]